MSVWLPDEVATMALAQRLAAVLPKNRNGWTVLLEGELGAGKSTFARALIVAMGHDGPVPSPTYTLVEPYDLPGGIIYHIDLYRLTEGDELRFLGWSELDDGLRLIEWPERAGQLAAESDLRVSLSYRDDGRTASFDALSARAEPLLTALGV